ncbi:MAG: hypothetical protein ABSG76_17880 [Xanthobacteraceae bacterium]
MAIDQSDVPADDVVRRALELAGAGNFYEGDSFLQALVERSETPAQALAWLDALAERFGEGPAMRPWVALARACQANVFQAAGSLGEAFNTRLRLVHAYSADRHPIVDAIVVGAMERICRYLNAKGETVKARRVLDEIADRCQHDDNPAHHIMIARLFDEVAGGVDVARPAGHAGAHPFDAALLAELDALVKRGEMTAATHRKHVDALHGLQASASTAAADLHMRALGVVEAYRRDGDPFALFLRNFDVETFRSTVPTADGDALLLGSYADEARIEAAIMAGLVSAEGLSRPVPMVGIANPSLGTARPRYQHAVPKLELPDRIWRAALIELADRAAMIVIEITSASPGVAFELRALSALGRQDATLAILSESGRGADPVLLGALLGQGPDHVPPLIADVCQVLRSFPHVVSEADLPFDDLRSVPVIAAALERIGRSPSSMPHRC